MFRASALIPVFALLSSSGAGAADPASSPRSELREAQVLAEVPGACEDRLKAGTPRTWGWIVVATQATGVGIGIANDVAITLTRGQFELLPHDFTKWLLFANEFANITATSTGKQWFYSGMRKRVADGIALGAILGSSLHAGATEGPLTGFAALAASYGLTYWFPNKYFHSIMVDVPAKLPAYLRQPLQTGVGKAVIGVSMVVALEIVLERAIELANHIPGFLHSLVGAAPHGLDRKLASEAASIPLSTALWLVLLDEALDTPDETARAKRAGKILLGSPANDLTAKERTRIRSILGSKALRLWATEAEISKVGLALASH
jgi:hypothetical protein